MEAESANVSSHAATANILTIVQMPYVKRECPLQCRSIQRLYIRYKEGRTLSNINARLELCGLETEGIVGG